MQVDSGAVLNVSIIDSLTTNRLHSYDFSPMTKQPQQGQMIPLLFVALIILIIVAVWTWKRLSVEAQDYIVDQAVPMAAIGLALAILLFISMKAVLRRRAKSQERAKLLTLFERETVQDKKLELAFALLEMNGYHVDGLETAVPTLKELFITTLQRALGDKQHRIRGMAASHLGALQDLSVVPLLVKALEDDHAYVRSCAALGLGRLRATEARERLKTVMEQDWDQTVRSRAREALERMRE
jgi:flagellar biosynthesis/type III secretory pathway M-ring protein FliF/YscJ